MKGVVNAAVGQENGSREHLKIAQQYFQVAVVVVDDVAVVFGAAVVVVVELEVFVAIIYRLLSILLSCSLLAAQQVSVTPFRVVSAWPPVSSSSSSSTTSCSTSTPSSPTTTTTTPSTSTTDKPKRQ